MVLGLEIVLSFDGTCLLHLVLVLVTLDLGLVVMGLVFLELEVVSRLVCLYLGSVSLLGTCLSLVSSRIKTCLWSCLTNYDLDLGSLDL